MKKIKSVKLKKGELIIVMEKDDIEFINKVQKMANKLYKINEFKLLSDDDLFSFCVYYVNHCEEKRTDYKKMFKNWKHLRKRGKL